MAELSPSSSSVLSTEIHAKHDVFLSFRGEDVRNNFVSFLYHALCRKGINTFIDYQLRKGDEISPNLLRVIQESSISVMVFSKNYASSKWCLDELVKILECRRLNGQIVVPIFYHVDPSDVRKQSGSYSEAFYKHDETLKDQKDRIQRWKDALTESANLSGWDLLDGRQESIFIDEITQDIIEKLNNLSSTYVDDLVGIQTRVDQIISSLRVGLADVRILGIWGMGGIGKTTVARTLFDKISTQFEGRCFLENIREDYGKYGPKHLQKKLLSVLLKENDLSMDISLKFFRDRLHRKKVLIILDDIDDKEQLEYLAGGHDWFGSGSRIIITTRDKQVLNGLVNEVYEAQKFINEEALKLFSHHAFKKSHPPEDYIELSRKAVAYAGGIPLALKVLGSYLFNKSKQKWESELTKLEKIPNKKVQNVLRVSFDGLGDTEQNILLDIACFFKGMDVDFVKAILDGCGYFPNVGLDILIDKSLLYIAEYNVLSMHDLIEDMGKEIVRQEHIKEPGKRSRLWNCEDIFHLFKNDSGTEVVEGIFLDLSETKELELREEAFAKMYGLRLLKFFSSNLVDSTRISPRGLKMLPHNLRYLHWQGFPYKSLPSNYHPKNLVGLDLHHSCVSHLWKGQMQLKHLKWINLNHSKYLLEVPDLSRAHNLEKIVLEGCIGISMLHPSIGTLSNLNSLNLRDCKNLAEVPDMSGAQCLQTLTLSGCSNLRNFPTFSDCMEHLSYLYLGGTSIPHVPSSIENLTGLVILDLENCKNLMSLPDSICNLKRLANLNLLGCESLNNLPENIGNLESLLFFKANGSLIARVPPSITCLKNLLTLSCNGGRETRSWSSLFRSLLFPRSNSQSSIPLQLPPLLGSFQNMTALNLSYCNLLEIPSFLDCLSSLMSLTLSGNSFESLPQSVCNLPALMFIDVSFCKRLRSLPEIPPSVMNVNAHECTSLESLPIDKSIYGGLNFFACQIFELTNCFKLAEKQFSSIMEAVSMRVYLWAIMVLYYYQQGIILSLYWFGFIFPGSELPQFLSNQSMGDSVTLQLSSHCSIDRYVGFAICIVIPFSDIPKEEPVGKNATCDCRIRLTFHDSGEYTKECNFWNLSIHEEYMFRRDHVIIGFVQVLDCLKDWPKDCNNVEAAFDFFAIKGDDFYLKPKKCGVSLIYVGEEEEKAQPDFSFPRLFLS